MKASAEEEEMFEPKEEEKYQEKEERGNTEFRVEKMDTGVENVEKHENKDVGKENYKMGDNKDVGEVKKEVKKREEGNEGDQMVEGLELSTHSGQTMSSYPR